MNLFCIFIDLDMRKRIFFDKNIFYDELFNEYLNLWLNKFEVCSIKNDISFNKYKYIFGLIIYFGSLVFFKKECDIYD